LGRLVCVFMNNPGSYEHRPVKSWILV